MEHVGAHGDGGLEQTRSGADRTCALRALLYFDGRGGGQKRNWVSKTADNLASASHRTCSGGLAARLRRRAAGPPEVGTPELAAVTEPDLGRYLADRDRRMTQ